MENSNRNLKIAKFLLKIAKSAYKNATKQKIEVSDKGDLGHDLLTNYDTFIEKFLIKKIKKYFPDSKIISEEFNANVTPAGTYFVIDPLDGTINFANNLNGLWGVQIAYVENDVTLASAVYVPNSADYYAAKGCGAYKNGKRFFTQRKDISHCILVCDCRIDGNSNFYRMFSKYVMKERRLGAACVEHALTAEGSVGVFIECICKPWDYIPGELLCVEAGCALKELGKYRIITCSQEVLNQVIEILNKKITDKDNHETI